MTATTYEARYELLNNNLGSDGDFLYHGLENAYETHWSQQMLVNLSTEEARAYIGRPFTRDCDPGPADVWHWAHQYYSPGAFVNCMIQKGLRERGYVMWDRARLCDWDIFGKPWEGSPDRYTSEEYNRRFDTMRESWAKRSEIWLRGGRGYWAEGDESRIIWPPKPKGRKEKLQTFTKGDFSITFRMGW